MYRNILVPIDRSDAAQRGLDEAIALAKMLRGRILLVNVVNELDGVPADLPGVDFRSIVEDLSRDGKAILAHARERASAQGVEADTRLVEVWGGRAGDEVIGLAKDWPAELIVCGTHGRRGIRRMLLGSDAEYIVRHSPVPVLLVRAGKNDEITEAGASLG